MGLNLGFLYSFVIAPNGFHIWQMKVRKGRYKLKKERTKKEKGFKNEKFNQLTVSLIIREKRTFI